MSTSTDKRELIMRKLLLALLLTGPVYAQGHLHLWQLVSKSTDPQNGQQVCQWRCNGLDGAHYATTTGNPCFRP